MRAWALHGQGWKQQTIAVALGVTPGAVSQWLTRAPAVVGPVHVGPRADFDGGGTVLRDATEYPRLTQGLLERGHAAHDTHLVLGEHFRRVLEEVAA